MAKTVAFQIIQFSISSQFKCKYGFIVKNISISSYSVCSNSSNSNNSVLQYSVSSIQLIDRALSAGTIPGQSGPESNGNEGVLHILQISYITRASPSDCFVSYSGHSLGGTPLQRHSLWILQPKQTRQRCPSRNDSSTLSSLLTSPLPPSFLDSLGVTPFMRFIASFRKIFHSSQNVIFHFSFHLRLSDSIHFQYSQVFIIIIIIIIWYHWEACLILFFFISLVLSNSFPNIYLSSLIKYIYKKICCPNMLYIYIYIYIYIN